MVQGIQYNEKNKKIEVKKVLKLIVSRAGYGKTTYIQQRIKELVNDNKEAVLIIPEQKKRNDEIIIYYFLILSLNTFSLNQSLLNLLKKELQFKKYSPELVNMVSFVKNKYQQFFLLLYLYFIKSFHFLVILVF